MAVTSRGSRRINGHFCDATDVGTHTVKGNCVGEFETSEAALEAQERVQSAKNHYLAKAKPYENEVSRLYVLRIAEMERAATNKDWTPLE